MRRGGLLRPPSTLCRANPHLHSEGVLVEWKVEGSRPKGVAFGESISECGAQTETDRESVFRDKKGPSSRVQAASFQG